MEKVNCLYCGRKCDFDLQGKDRICNCAGYIEKYKEGHSEQYKKIREEAETTWPQWKIDAANRMMIGKHTKKLERRVRDESV